MWQGIVNSAKDDLQKLQDELNRQQKEVEELHAGMHTLQTCLSGQRQDNERLAEQLKRAQDDVKTAAEVEVSSICSMIACGLPWQARRGKKGLTAMPT